MAYENLNLPDNAIPEGKDISHIEEGMNELSNSLAESIGSTSNATLCFVTAQPSTSLPYLKVTPSTYPGTLLVYGRGTMKKIYWYSSNDDYVIDNTCISGTDYPVSVSNKVIYINVNQATRLWIISTSKITIETSDSAG